MVKTAIIGLGKMGLSHAAILGAHPNVKLVALCDTSQIVLNAFKQYNSQPVVYENYNKLFNETSLDAVFIATPTKIHFPIAKKALEKKINIFCEKPFTTTIEEGSELVELTESNKVINQVGFHNHFIGTFKELKRLLKIGLIGDLLHYTGEAYGPVVTSSKGSTWRSKPEEGGGCLNDYASHVINLIQETFSRPIKVKGTSLKKFFSREVEDAVYSTLIHENGLTGILSVNWSDETYRKMSTSLTVYGTKGKIICDATEIKIFLKEENLKEKLPQGWSIKYITDLAIPVDFYLRGEEYSAQIDYFIDNIMKNKAGAINTFEQALYTDKTIEMLIKDSQTYNN